MHGDDESSEVPECLPTIDFGFRNDRKTVRYWTGIGSGKGVVIE